MDPQRRLVKLSDNNLWKASASEGTADWRPGYEIRSNVLGISLFTIGSEEELHYHERTWELYEVFEGYLKIAVKPFRKAPWEVVTLAVHNMILMTPATLHLVESTCLHITLVIQPPLALLDKVVVIQQDEIDAAKAALLEAG